MARCEKTRDMGCSIIAEYMTRTEYKTTFENGECVIHYDKVNDSYTEDAPRFVVRQHETIVMDDGREYESYDDLDVFDDYDEARAYVYYIEHYLPEFDIGNGEPVVFKEFFQNDWEEIGKVWGHEDISNS